MHNYNKKLLFVTSAPISQQHGGSSKQDHMQNDQGIAAQSQGCNTLTFK